MVAKIILNENIDEKIFSHYLELWEKSDNAIIRIEEMSEKSKHILFQLALNRLPESFSEAVIDLFLEDENFFINDDLLMKCVKNGSIGLQRSIFYRRSIPEYIRNLCAKS